MKIWKATHPNHHVESYRDCSLWNDVHGSIRIRSQWKSWDWTPGRRLRHCWLDGACGDSWIYRMMLPTRRHSPVGHEHPRGGGSWRLTESHSERVRADQNCGSKPNWAQCRQGTNWRIVAKVLQKKAVIFQRTIRSSKTSYQLDSTYAPSPKGTLWWTADGRFPFPFPRRFHRHRLWSQSHWRNPIRPLLRNCQRFRFRCQSHFDCVCLFHRRMSAPILNSDQPRVIA